MSSLSPSASLNLSKNHPHEASFSLSTIAYASEKILPVYNILIIFLQQSIYYKYILFNKYLWMVN